MKNNDVVLIELDRQRELRYGHKAIKQLTAATGKSLDAISGEDLDFGELEKIIYYGLLSDARKNGENLRLEEMEDLLDQAPFQYVIEKFQEAISIAFGNVQAPEGNVGVAPKQAQKQTASEKNGTGNSL